MYWILADFENLTDAALEEKEPMLYDIVIMKIDGLQNQDIRKALQEKYGKTYSIEYISSLFNNKIPKLIADEAEKRELIWYYTNVEKGRDAIVAGKLNYCTISFFQRIIVVKTDFIVFAKNVGAVKRKVVELMYIVDTNVLMSLNTLDGIIDKLKEIYIPVEVLSELDKHKTAEGLKGFQARRAIRNINQNIDK